MLSTTPSVISYLVLMCRGIYLLTTYYFIVFAVMAFIVPKSTSFPPFLLPFKSGWTFLGPF